MNTLRLLQFLALCLVLGACSAGGCSAIGGPIGGMDSGTGFDTGTTADTGAPSDEECYNGIDDNGDGLIDERCTCVVGERQPCWSGSATRRGVGACRDGVQSCDPYGEFTAFGSCVGEVGPSAEIPGNGIDEDCDGGDEGGNPCAASEFGEGCGDGTDEDCDGLVDCADPDCSSDSTCSAGCVPAEFGELCTDGIDNDCDGVVDCLDAECATHDRCRPPPPPPPGCTAEFPFFVEIVCGDGRDNDCDGDIDCADSDCMKPGSCGCDSQEAMCANGMDDDCDGSSDCSDLDCQQCAAGSYRYCDEPTYCHWGRQVCGSDGRWGTCVETTDLPGSCTGTYYSASCCTAAGECCQNYPVDETSIGDCATRVVCRQKRR